MFLCHSTNCYVLWIEYRSVQYSWGRPRTPCSRLHQGHTSKIRFVILYSNMYMHNPSLRMVPVHEPHSFPATLDRDDSAVFYQELWTTLFHVLGKRQLFCIAIDVWSSCSTPIPETSQDPMSSSKTGKKPLYSGGQECPLRQDATIGMKMLQQTDPEGSGVAGASNPVKTHRGQWPA